MQVAYALCECGSGKKTKFCCKTHLKNKEASSREVHLVNYEITFDAIESPGSQMSDEAQNEFEKAHKLLQKKHAKKAAKIYEALIPQYNDKPELKNNLAVAYKLLGRKEEHQKLIEEVCQDYPNYLFAKIALADKCLEQGKPERIPEIFHNKYDLKMIYPHRKVFHVSEFLCFSGVMCRYFLEIGKEKQARILLDAMEEIAPDEYLTQITRQSYAAHTLRELCGKFSDPELFRRSAKFSKTAKRLSNIVRD